MIMTIIFIFVTLLRMTSLPILLAALTALATAAGGFLAIKSKDRLHLVLGLAALTSWSRCL